DRESTNRIVLFRVNESGRGIEQETHFLEQEGIMFNQRANIFTEFSDIRIINMTAQGAWTRQESQNTTQIDQTELRFTEHIFQLSLMGDSVIPIKILRALAAIQYLSCLFL